MLRDQYMMTNPWVGLEYQIQQIRNAVVSWGSLVWGP